MISGTWPWFWHLVSGWPRGLFSFPSNGKHSAPHGQTFADPPHLGYHEHKCKELNDFLTLSCFFFWTNIDSHQIHSCIVTKCSNHQFWHNFGFEHLSLKSEIWTDCLGQSYEDPDMDFLRWWLGSSDRSRCLRVACIGWRGWILVGFSVFRILHERLLEVRFWYKAAWDVQILIKQ